MAASTAESMAANLSARKASVTGGFDATELLEEVIWGALLLEGTDARTGARGGSVTDFAKMNGVNPEKHTRINHTQRQSQPCQPSRFLEVFKELLLPTLVAITSLPWHLPLPTVNSEIVRRDRFDRNQSVVFFVHHSNFVILQRQFKQGNQIVRRELCRNCAANQIWKSNSATREILFGLDR